MRMLAAGLLGALLVLAACAPAASNLTPIAAPGQTTPTRLAADAPPPAPTATQPPASPTTAPTTSPTETSTPPATRTPVQADSLSRTPPPTPLPPIADSDDTDIFLLIGTDAQSLDRITRTDAILLVAVHRAARAATLLAVPRDLYVYIPTRGMDRINTAFAHGTQTGYPGGGAALLRDTIAYSLGIHARRYARIDFSGFEALVDALGGIEVSVTCALQDWALRPGGNPADEADWAMLTLPAGVHTLDGRTALWYVRSRRTSTDVDRGRRQQDVLRAIGQQVRSQGWLTALPGLWELLTGYVETDITLDQVLSLAPLALDMDLSRADRLILQRGTHYRSWTAPGGEAVLLPIGDGIAELAADFAAPPAENQLVLESTTIEIQNHSGRPDLARIAAAELAWQGLPARYNDSGGGAERLETVIIDFTGRVKDNPLPALQAFLGVDDAHVIVQPMRDRSVDFRVELGRDYEPCVYPVLPPQ